MARIKRKIGFYRSGDIVGRLTLLKSIPNNIEGNFTGRTQWLCRCSCGTIRMFAPNNLQQGISNSCGCLRRELRSNPCTLR